MKNLKWGLIFTTFLLTTLTSYAGGVACQIDNSCPGYHDNLPIGSFCVQKDDHLQGFIFYENGTVKLIDSSAGMPNPNIAYEANMITTHTFVIDQLNSHTGVVISRSVPYYVTDSTYNSISDGTTVYSTFNCK